MADPQGLGEATDALSALSDAGKRNAPTARRISTQEIETEQPPKTEETLSPAKESKQEKFKPTPQENFEAGFEENILDKYDQVTYNFKFFMVSEANAIEGRVFDPANRIIIAQSGVTAKIGINDVIIDTVNAPMKNARSATPTKFSFTLFEQSGASLLDNIYISSIDLGIANYTKIPYYLELKFKARQVADSAPIKEGTNVDNTISQTYLWPIIITAIETTITSGGSKYEISAAPYFDIAQTDQFGVIDKALTISASTVEEALTKITDALNERQKEKKVSDRYKEDIYSITAHPDIGDLKLYDPAKVSNSGEATSGTSKEKASDNTKKEIHFDPKTSIIRGIENLVTASHGYQEFIKKSKTPNDNTSNKDKKETMKQLHRIITNTTILKTGYDALRGDYARKYEYIIMPYKMGTLQAGPDETSTDGTEKYQEYKRKKLLQKHYNYIFTGRNDQVLNFDLKFNFGWFVNIPRQGSIFNDYVNNIDGAESRLFPDNYKEFVEFKKKIANALKHIPSNPGHDPTTVGKLHAEINASENLSEEEAEILKNLLDRRIRAPEETPPNNFKPSNRFATDVTIKDALAKYDNIDTLNRVLPLSYLETDPDVDTSNSVEQANLSGREYVNSMLTQAFSAGGGDLVNITMTIKGDPFWISPATYQGFPDSTTQIGVKTISISDYETSPLDANTTISQNFILFTLRTPVQPDEDTGVIAPKVNSNVYNGVYAVNSTEHKFSNGQFTQELTCVIDPLVSYNEILNLEKINDA